MNGKYDAYYRYALYALVFVVLCAGSAFVTMRIMSRGVSVTVPNLTGMGLDEAREELGDAGISLKVEAKDYDATVPAGHVLKQDIPPGTLIKERMTVKVSVSKGQMLQRIPSLTGMKIDQALLKLLSLKLAVCRALYVHTEATPAGVVIGQKPLPGEYTGGEITLIASAGPYELIYFCPYFTGMAKEDALKLASELGLDVELKEPSNGSFPLVISGQTPAPGAEIKRGSKVSLTLGGTKNG